MLVAMLVRQRIEATEAEKGPEYHCPECRNIVILKKGRILVHHFAHKPPVNCSWAKGETREHLKAKHQFKNDFLRMGFRAEVEFQINSLPNDRRADVVVWLPNGNQFALELQHTPIDYETLEARTRSYIRSGVLVIWIPFLRPKLRKNAQALGPNEDGDFLIEKYPARPLEKWVHGFNFGNLWMYDPSRNMLWKGKLNPQYIYVEESCWYGSDGYENSAGGYRKTSKRWRQLRLWGPYRLDQVQIMTVMRPSQKMGKHKYPGGKVGKFVLREP